MREIIFVQIGQCGNQFWETISNEHMIDPCGHYTGTSALPLERINVYYNEASNYKFVPRVIITDLEPGTMNTIRTSQYGCIFSPDSFLFGFCGAGNNWARGHYTEGAELMDELLDKIRMEAEMCDCMQGFQMVHSIGGGTGSGMGTLLLSHLADEYPDRIINTCSVIPSPRVSETVVEPYNAILSLSEMINNTNETFCIDNEALYHICEKRFLLNQPNYNNLNYIIAQAISGVTTCFRFPGQLNTDLRKLYVNMVPFPKLHFFVPGFAPLQHCCSECYRKISVRELIIQLFNSDSLMAACSPEMGKYLAAAIIFRGRMSTRCVDETLSAIQKQKPEWFVDFIPNGIKSAICDIPPRGYNMTATFLGNTTSIKTVFARVLRNYSLMLRRKAFVHWYLSEGMELAEFVQAENYVQNIIDEYTNYEQTDSESSRLQFGDSDNDD